MHIRPLCLLLFLLLVPLCLLPVETCAETATFRGQSYDLDSTYIDLGKKNVQDWDAFYAFLKQFPNLKKVDMFETSTHKEQIEEMVSQFPQIEFGWTICFSEHRFRTDITAFSTLHFSKDRKHADEYISLVRYCKNLKALDIGHNAVTDLSFLYDLPDLRVLIIAVNQISDLTPVASLKKLEYLEIFNNYITDLTPLAGLTHLLDLNISYNYITDITPLLGLKHLKRLWTCQATDRDHNVSLAKEKVALLQETIPGLENYNYENPTGGTWRSHPHHTIIRNMFRRQTYIPFEDSFPDNYDDEADEAIENAKPGESAKPNQSTEPGVIRIYIPPRS